MPLVVNFQLDNYAVAYAGEQLDASLSLQLSCTADSTAALLQQSVSLSQSTTQSNSSLYSNNNLHQGDQNNDDNSSAVSLDNTQIQKQRTSVGSLQLPQSVRIPQVVNLSTWQQQQAQQEYSESALVSNATSSSSHNSEQQSDVYQQEQEPAGFVVKASQIKQRLESKSAISAGSQYQQSYWYWPFSQTNIQPQNEDKQSVVQIQEVSAQSEVDGTNFEAQQEVLKIETQPSLSKSDQQSLQQPPQSVGIKSATSSKPSVTSVSTINSKPSISDIVSPYMFNQANGGEFKMLQSPETEFIPSAEVVEQLDLNCGFIQFVGYITQKDNLLSNDQIEKRRKMLKTASAGAGSFVAEVYNSLIKENAIPVVLCPPVVVFSNIRLRCSESRIDSKQYKCQFKLPQHLPPSFICSKMRIKYMMIFGIQRQFDEQPYLINMPVRVQNSCLNSADKMQWTSPLIMSKDRIQFVNQDVDIEQYFQQRRESDGSYTRHSQSSNVLPQDSGSNQTSTARRRSSESRHKAGKSLLQVAALLQQQTQAFQFDIQREGVHVCQMTLNRKTQIIGGSILINLDFSDCHITCFAVGIHLESVVSVRKLSKTQDLVETHSSVFKDCYQVSSLSCRLNIQSSVTGDFSMANLDLAWRIRFEFQALSSACEFENGLYSHDAFVAEHKDDSQCEISHKTIVDLIQLPPKIVDVDRFNCLVPIQILPADYETSSIYPSSQTFIMLPDNKDDQ
ncbi:hypothetical protein MIR68_011003 [Amoeboaphelidium protococcarum]|nr:hypothetical protein MIR68_011003 [Amoeboaphelidium protococcarum]